MSRKLSTPERAVTAAMLVLLLVTAALFFVQATRTIGFPYPLDYGEGPLLDQALRLTGGENIYDRELQRAPYTVSNYPPLFVATVSVAAQLFGPA